MSGTETGPDEEEEAFEDDDDAEDEEMEEELDEQGRESFPASDPPGSGQTTGP